MDFMQDMLDHGEAHLMFNLLDDFNHETPVIEIDFLLPSKRINRALDQLIHWRGRASVIRCDNEPKYISQTAMAWTKGRGIQIEVIQPGRPQRNKYVERFNRTVRYERLRQCLSVLLAQNRKRNTVQMRNYHHDRPHIAPDGMPPKRSGRPWPRDSFTPRLDEI
jgi:putative transposase